MAREEDMVNGSDNQVAYAESLLRKTRESIEREIVAYGQGSEESRNIETVAAMMESIDDAGAVIEFCTNYASGLQMEMAWSGGYVLMTRNSIPQARLAAWAIENRPGLFRRSDGTVIA